MSLRKTFLILSLALSCAALCGGCYKSCRQGPAHRNQTATTRSAHTLYPRYDSSNVVEVRGRIINVERVPIMSGDEALDQLFLRTDQGELPVTLGPRWFIPREDFAKLSPNTEVFIKGSRVNVDGRPFLIAQEVRIGDTVLKFRDSGGMPLWAGKKKP